MNAAPARIGRSLSSSLVRINLLCACLLGLAISVVQVGLDYYRAREQPEEDMQALFSLVREPVTAVVFSLDPRTAGDLLSGMLKQPALASARILLPEGRVFAEHSRELREQGGRRLNDLLFGATRHYAWPLQADLPGAGQREELGTLQVEVDTYRYGRDFLDRAWVTLLSSLFYALAISAILLLVFYLRVTRPLRSLILSIARVDIDAPEDTRLREPAGHADNEIGVLVRSTNQHLQALGDNLRQVREAEGRLQFHSEQLESTVAERTRELSRSVQQLQAAQRQLIESEKLAALGGLVAGVAHEVNTPLGIAVTASSVLSEALADLRTQFQAQTLTSESFQALLELAQDSNAMLASNIARAAKLISDFKQTAVDQVSEARCEFEVQQALDALIASLHPETRKVPVTVELDCESGLHMRSLPGVLTQVVANLIINSVRHAFADTPEARITLRIRSQGEGVELDYRDNGCGVPAALHERIFEPFFTTRRGTGGTGLGLNIVYNLVTRKLQGRLEFHSEEGAGVHFLLWLPRRLESAEPA
ncbi:ATP-binding protein [Pseudomonas tohonis]|uniref:ATP-binding protein n=1 Tax=Pseudomonas tohonis TaxID=2725477 RepID=UPI00255C260C|nr:ATP-binding protein [Pseudomonas tohonis]